MKENAFIALACMTISLSLFSCHSTKQAEMDTPRRVILGDEQFEAYTPLLEGKRIALFSNHSGIVGDKITLSDGRSQYGGFTSSEERDASLIHFGKDTDGNDIIYGEHILDALIFRGLEVTAIFSPEHGFRGNEDAGAHISSGVDEKTGVPILSLHENSSTHSPRSQSMETFDTLLVDMQDVGLRYYTYYIALYYLMDACAKNGKPVLILDRPNPNGFYVDGTILEDDYVSGIGLLPIPTVHGMTLGELALMINGEGWLTAGKNACNLTIIPCKNYTHQTKYALIRAPSPNIRDMRAVYLYASTCFFENTLVSVARGTDFPFEAYGSPYFENALSATLRKEPIISFTPESIQGATNPPFLGKTCYGIDLRKKPVQEIWKEGSDISYLADAYKIAKNEGKENMFWGKADEQGKYWIDLLSGSASLRMQLTAGKTAAEIKAGWQKDIEHFKSLRKPYLLYEE